MDKLAYDYYCNNCDNIRERYEQQNDNDICECGKKMKLININESYFKVDFKRIHSLPIEEKKKYLRKRADKDFEKNHKEKKRVIDNEHHQQMKEIVGKTKDQIMSKKNRYGTK